MAILFLKTSYGEQRLPLFKSKVQSRMILKVHQFTIGLRIKALGYKSYSLAISWSRTFPFGNGTVNHVPPPNLPVLDSDYRLPSDVMWGMAGAAFQVEGAVKADNKGPTFWDWAIHKVPGFIVDNHTADVSDNHYWLYKQDAQRLKALGMTHFSLTIAWSRIFPFGNGTVNQVGLQHYIDEIDYYLVELGIEPIVTLYHFDLPQALQNWYGGWLNEKIVHDFANYSRVVFNALAPKVKT